MTVRKEDVIVRHCEFDGTLISEQVRRRNVYRPKGKPAYIRSMGSPRRLDGDNPPLVIFKPLSPPFDASFDATIGKALRNLPPGTPVKVVPLP